MLSSGFSLSPKPSSAELRGVKHGMSTSPQTLVFTESDTLVSEMASRNALLGDLLSSPAIKNHLLHELRIVSLSTNQVLYEQGDQIDIVYFPLDAVISGLAIMEDGTTIETCMIGREGMCGISTILGSGRSRQWNWVLLSGNAIQLETKLLERLVVHNEEALTALLKCYRSLITQTSQRCVCNTRHTILERLCCWLLMLHDRVGASNLKLTQEMIASRVGARRAGITVAAGMLQELGAIEYHRGQLHISNQHILEMTVCECYTIMQAEFKDGRPPVYSTTSL